MDLLKGLFFIIVEFNRAWVPFYDKSLGDIYLYIITLFEFVLAILLLFYFFYLVIKDISGSSKKDALPQVAGGFRRRFERIPVDLKIDYRFDSQEEFKKGICKDLSVKGLRIEIDEDSVPDLKQRVEFVLDGRQLKLNKDERVKVGGFVVRVIDKKTNKSVDIGVEFFHLLKHQHEMIEAVINKMKQK
jgi:hypothetical protein